MKINWENNAAAQDMIGIIMRKKNLSASEAVSFAINRDMHQQIIKLGYASCALPIWGHGDPTRVWLTLDDPVTELELSKLQGRLVDDVAEKEHVDFETAICYFLIFTMDAFGYHI